tara:strand:- start:19605 stop:19919 length:315 start_codon:yes stop_codon:yes gene_type:complete
MRPMISKAMVSFTLTATTMTANRTIKLPILDAKAKEMSFTIPRENIPVNREDPNIKRAAPKLAPELMPSTKGPAKGFLNKVCINNPLKAKPLPTNMAVNALGIR